MKKLLLIAITFLMAGMCSGQNALTYTDVVVVDSSITQDQLFNNARSWFNTAFKNSKEVIQIIDKSTGEISGKGVIPYSSSVFVGSAVTNGNINFSVSVFVKNGKYKYEFSNFSHEGSRVRTDYGWSGPSSFGLITNSDICTYQISGSTQKWKDKVWNDIKSQINSYIIPVIDELKITMTNKKISDW